MEQQWKGNSHEHSKGAVVLGPFEKLTWGSKDTLELQCGYPETLLTLPPPPPKKKGTAEESQETAAPRAGQRPAKDVNSLDIYLLVFLRLLLHILIVSGKGYREYSTRVTRKVAQI